MNYNVAPLTSEQIADIKASQVWDGYPGYADRLRMASDELVVMDDRLVVPDDGLWYLDAHPNRINAPAHQKHLVAPLEPDEASIAHWKRLGLELDHKGRPIHPYGRQLLATVGVVTGPGFYWKLGPNGTTNLIVCRPHDSGEIEYAAIQRNDPNRNDGKKRWALPGGFVDVGELHHEAAMREFDEELGLSVKGLGTTAMVGDIIVSPSNSRDTFHAWGEDSAVRISPFDQSFLRDVQLRPNPAEVLDFAWLTIAEMRQMVAQRVFPGSHLRFVELSNV